MELIWFTAMSMDGKVASAEESLDFLDVISDHASSADDFPRFYASVDAIIVGAGTLRWLAGGGHGWPHAEKPTWLVSHDESLVTRVGVPGTLRRYEGDLATLVRTIEATGAKRVWVSGGGDVAGQLLEADLIDEVIVTIAPIALGAGPGLFGARPLPPRTFDVVEIAPIAGNAVRVRWRRPRGAATTP
jgi:riboflavin biosynthesis pyrimidine reductase